MRRSPRRRPPSRRAGCFSGRFFGRLAAMALACGLLAAAPAGAQDAYEDLLDLPEVPEDAVENQVQQELDEAGERIEATLRELRAAPPTDAADAAGTVTVGLEEAVALALADNPALAAAEERRREVAAGVTEVRADALPQLTGVASYGLSRNPSFLNSPDFEDILEQFPGGDFEPAEQELYSVGVSVTQPIYTFGKLGAAIELARVAVDATEAQIAAVRMDTALAAAEAYFEVLATREALAVGVVQLRVRSDALEVVRARYDIGEATRLELLRAQSAVAEVTPTIAELAGDLAVAESELRNALGLEPGVELRVAGGVDAQLPSLGAGDPEAVGGDAEPAAPASPVTAPQPLSAAPELAELWAAARRNRPEIADLELQREVLARRQQVTRAEGRPQVELNGFLGREARFYDNLDDPLYDNYAVSLDLSWEFFDGGRRRGQVEQLESQRRQLAFRLEELFDAIELDLARSRTAYRTALERWRAAETAATAAREASRVARESYREGVALQTDWLDAQRQETEAEITAVDAYYDARTEAARLARAVGAYPTESWGRDGWQPADLGSVAPAAGAEEEASDDDPSDLTAPDTDPEPESPLDTSISAVPEAGEEPL